MCFTACIIRFLPALSERNNFGLSAELMLGLVEVIGAHNKEAPFHSLPTLTQNQYNFTMFDIGLVCWGVHILFSEWATDAHRYADVYSSGGHVCFVIITNFPLGSEDQNIKWLRRAAVWETCTTTTTGTPCVCLCLLSWVNVTVVLQVF